MNEPSDQREISKYNDAGLSVARLHEIWTNCRHYLKTGNFKDWKSELDNAWLELYPDILRQDSKAELIKKNLALIKLISETKNRAQLLFILMKRQEFLREIQDMAGKAGSYVSEDDEDFE